MDNITYMPQAKITEINRINENLPIWINIGFT